MSQITISCTCCGSVLTLEEDVNVRECPACGTSNARPKVTGDSLLTLQRATEQRLACDFHNAELSYQQVLLYRPDEHEALWGRLLCRYGVEYVEDPATKRRMPTVHTVQMKPLQAQPDFVKACKLAPAPIRAQYELDAAYIDDAQAEIRQKAKSCKPYDVFLCHKTTKPGSKDKTEDFHRATQLYHFLKDQGVKVFFAPECLQDAAGANYEAGIYHALHTAKMMLLICSEPEYLTSPWVRSEWSRFLDIIEQEPEKQIVPLLYDHFDPDDLPPQFLFGNIQGMDMSDINAPQRLTRIVLKAVRKQEPKPEVVPQPEPAPQPVVPQQKPTPAPEVKPTPKPQPAPQPQPKVEPKDMKYSVTLSFPGLQNRWTTVPEWCIYKADRKTFVADVKWDSTIVVPIDAERTQLFYGTKPTKKVTRTVAVIYFFIAVMMALLSAMANTPGGILALAAFVGVLGLIILLIPARPQVYGNIIVTDSKRYELSWSWIGGNKFKVVER